MERKLGRVEREKLEGIDIDGNLVSEPTELGVERFQIQFRDEGLERFVEDPDEILHDILKRWDRFEINSVRFVGNLDAAKAEAKVQCYHVVYPDAERSNTICF